MTGSGLEPEGLIMGLNVNAIFSPPLFMCVIITGLHLIKVPLQSERYRRLDKDGQADRLFTYEKLA
jgi:hypothetical protein